MRVDPDTCNSRQGRLRDYTTYGLEPRLRLDHDLFGVESELGAGSIVGSGTVSNKQGDLWGSSIAHGGVGYCCLAEVRTYETIEQGQPATPFMRAGDTVRIEMFDAEGRSVFGTIENTVAPLGA